MYKLFANFYIRPSNAFSNDNMLSKQTSIKKYSLVIFVTLILILLIILPVELADLLERTNFYKDDCKDIV